MIVLDIYAAAMLEGHPTTADVTTAEHASAALKTRRRVTGRVGDGIDKSGREIITCRDSGGRLSATREKTKATTGVNREQCGVTYYCINK